MSASHKHLKLLDLMHTYDLDSMSWRGCDVPGALLAAGILVWPVRTAQGSTGTVDLMFTLSWTHTQANTHRERKLQSWLHRKRSEEIERKEGAKRGNQMRERKVFKETHPGDKFSVKYSHERTYTKLLEYDLQCHPKTIVLHDMFSLQLAVVAE